MPVKMKWVNISMVKKHLTDVMDEYKDVKTTNKIIKFPELKEYKIEFIVSCDMRGNEDGIRFSWET